MMINRIFNKIRRAYYQIQYGKNVVIDGKNIVLSNVAFSNAAFVAHNAELQNCEIGNHSSIGRYTKLRDCSIGKYCSISWDCTIGAPTHPFTTITSSAITYRKEYGLVSQDTHFEQKKTMIGNDVWVGCGVTVISGVKVGDGAVIGAGAVVTQDIPAYEIWAGIPARKIADRFDKSLVERIIKISWWDWSEDVQKSFLDLFSEDLNEEVMSKIERRYKDIIAKER